MNIRQTIQDLFRKPHPAMKTKIDTKPTEKEQEDAADQQHPMEPNSKPKSTWSELMQQIEAKDRLIADQELKIKELQAIIKKREQKQEQEQEQKQEQATDKKHQDTEPQDINTNKLLVSIQTKIKELSTQIYAKNKTLINENAILQEKLNEKQDRLEQIIQTSQEDRYRKDKIKLINKYIYHVDLIRKTLYDFNLRRDQLSNIESVNFLEQQLQAVAQGIEATLDQEMVERIQTGDRGSKVNPDLQETIDTVSTNDPNLAGKIHDSINPGYIWTLPYILKAKITDKGDELKTYRFLIRPEQIITYKFNKE